MDADLTTRPSGLQRTWGRARRHLGAEQTRSGYALLLSSLVTSGLGLVYWFGAARLYDAEALGRGAALVSAMLLITSLATAGLKRGLIRFVRAAGPGGRRLIVRVYIAGVLLSLLFGVVFLAGIGGWADDIDGLRGGFVGPALLLVAVAAWAIFVLQDAALIGGRRSGVVPISNAVFSVAKIVALSLLVVAPFDQEWSVLLSWAAPAVLVAVVVNVWALGGGLRFEPVRSATDPPTVRTVLRFTSAEYVASLFWQGAVYLTPLLVLAEVGATANAHYYLAFQIAYGVFLISSNITDALVADAAASPQDLAVKVRRAATQIAALLVPSVVILVVFARPIMSVFGPGYAQEGATVLRLLALAGALNSVTTLFVAVAHIRRRLPLVVIVHVVMAVLTIGLAAELAPSRGLRGVGEAWLVAQIVSVVLGGLLIVRSEWGMPTGRNAVIGFLSGARSRVNGWATHRSLPDRLAALPDDLLPTGELRVLAHQHDLTVLSVGSDEGPVVARLARMEAGRTVVAAHAGSLDRIQADPRLADLCELVPKVVRHDPDDWWLVETARPGAPVAAVVDAEERNRAIRSVLASLADMHAATRDLVFVGPEELATWVHRPISTVAPLVQGPAAADGLAVLHQRLLDDLADRTVIIGFCHGDASIDNILVEASGAVSGLIDWESSTIGVPEVDTFLLLLSRRTGWAGGELGEVVVDVLRNGWRPDELDLLRSAPSPNTHLRPTTVLLLAWLAHVAANLDKTSRYRNNRWWLRHNVERVLAAVAQDADLSTLDELDVASVAPEPGWVPATSGAQRATVPTTLSELLWRSSRASLALGSGAVAGLAGLAVWLGAPLALRIPLVLLALVAMPAVALARRLHIAGGIARPVVGTALAVSADVLGAEVLLYADLWSPGLLLAAVSVGTVILAAGGDDPEVAEP